MRRYVIITVGKTHSGKTTFAHKLEQQLENAIVVDQDNHAEFINNYYTSLQPKKGPNTLKHAISQTIVDYAVNETNCHLIICNSNRNKQSRLDLLKQFRNKGFATILIFFDIPHVVLQERIKKTKRSTAIFRSASTYDEVLERQQAEPAEAPSEDEADHMFAIKNEDRTTCVMQKIKEVVNN